MQARGSNLVVRVGNPEEELLSIANEVGADVVYFHQEVTLEDVKLERRVQKTLEVRWHYSCATSHASLDDILCHAACMSPFK